MAFAGERIFTDTGMMTINDSLPKMSLGDRTLALFAGVEADSGWSYRLNSSELTAVWVIGMTVESWRDAGKEGVMYSGGITPVLRWKAAWPVTLEAGVGVHLVGHRPMRKLSTTAQFSDILGIHYRHSDKLQLGYRFMHLSNAGFKQPNLGVNFHFLHLAFSF